MRTPIEILVKAIHILANDVRSDDGVANAAIYEAAQRLEEQNQRIHQLEDRIRRASIAFFEDVPDDSVASGMLAILEEERGQKP